MSVRGGREFLAVPGPTTIPDEVLQAMQRPAVEIFSKPLIALTDSLLRDLGRLFATEGRCYIYIANGHGAWEAALSTMPCARPRSSAACARTGPAQSRRYSPCRSTLAPEW